MPRAFCASGCGCVRQALEAACVVGGRTYWVNPLSAVLAVARHCFAGCWREQCRLLQAGLCSSAAPLRLLPTITGSGALARLPDEEHLQPGVCRASSAQEAHHGPWRVAAERLWLSEVAVEVPPGGTRKGWRGCARRGPPPAPADMRGGARKGPAQVIAAAGNAARVPGCLIWVDGLPAVHRYVI